MQVLALLSDTIYALATPPGMGAIGVIRVSGHKTFDLVNALFPSKDIISQKTHTLHVGYLKDGDKVLDEAVLSLFKGPHSYTGEDVIEISCHGSAYIQQQVMKALESKGARMALPGEFTQRAFLNGKMDLAQAESVADVIAAQSEAAQQTALQQLRGGFSDEMKALREKLINFAALIELELDFSQEDVQFADRSALYQLISELQLKIQKLLSSFALGNVIKNGVSVAIVGKPNAGKSTLLNAMLNEERAIVSNIAGTTRDTIEETLNIDGILFRLIDTAGIRDNTSDEIEQIGVGKSLEKIKTANIVLLLLDMVQEKADSIRQILSQLSAAQHLIIVANKMDIADQEVATDILSELSSPVVYISAKEKSSIETLKKKLYASVIDGEIATENTIITNARHETALRKASEALQDVRAGMDAGVTSDLLALDIRRTLHYLGEITGAVEIDRDILGTIFGKFCIGK